MSELEALCEALLESLRGLPALAAQLQERATLLRRLSAQIQQAARLSAAGPGVDHVVQNLDRAAATMLDSAHSLVEAVRQGESFVVRTIESEGRGGGVAPSTAAGSQPTYGLEAQDVAAIADYTGAGYKEINPMLRGQTPLNVDIMIRSAALSRALGKLPSYAGTVVRGRDLTASEVSFYEPGSVVREPGFTSSDTFRPFPGNTTFYIESKTGRDISELSTYGPATGGKEHEVLFNAGTKFLVQFNEIVDGNRVILMEEVIDRG